MAVPVSRILDKLDSYLNKEDYSAADRHLRYWLAEADALGDSRGAFAVLNEMIGLYRKCGMETEGLSACEQTLLKVTEMGIEDTVGAATAYINAATAYKSFNRNDLALPLYEKARVIYERDLEQDVRLAGLCNNMALALAEDGQYEEALRLYEKALKILEAFPESEPEQAVTYLNMADLIQLQTGQEEEEEKTAPLLDRAEELLHAAWESGKRDGNYAFVAGKCAPVFRYYGRFMTAGELEKRAVEIRNR